MPQPRKYTTRAEQQAAYRKRRVLSEQELLAHKGLPPLPAIATLPGNARWRAMRAQAHLLLSAVVVEMQAYHDERSEPWQESAKADDFLAKLEQLEETIEQLQGIE